MFTGIIEETGKLLGLRPAPGGGGKLSIRCRTVLDGTRAGDSIAVNGVCLTVTGLDAAGFTADVMPESLRCSTLGLLSPGSRVNLERAMPANGRFGGHIVTGHIDGRAAIRSIRREGNALWCELSCDRELLQLIARKGSVALDGISLTVSDVGKDGFAVSVIPHTAAVTRLSDLRAGDLVNLEIDCMARYAQRLLGLEAHSAQPGGITAESLAAMGF
ncbi:MAG: riboflavin synthase [Oscillospiraceae bacterium]|nr:MAG: riboflavin synthase [Oscillospiraceae bacterium]